LSLPSFVLLCSSVHDVVSREIGATRHYKHSSSVDAWYDVRTVTDSLLKDSVFVFTSNRVVNPPAAVVDLYSKGTEQIWKGREIERYVKKRLYELGEDVLQSSNEVEVDEEEESESLDGLDNDNDDTDEFEAMLRSLL
jgi:hypothetical protein